MIKVLNQAMIPVGIIRKTTSSSRLESLNSENTLDFEADLDYTETISVDENSIYDLNGDFFDTSYFHKSVNDDGSFTVQVQSDHVSYRLNNPEFDVEYFTELDIPVAILSKILDGTGFTAGSVEFSEAITFSLQESCGRRQLLMEFVAYLNGEIEFVGFIVHIRARRGSSSAKILTKGKNVNVVSKTVDKRKLTDEGTPTVSYSCEPIYLPGSNYSLGDSVRLIQNDLNINEEFRIVSINYDPYNASKVSFQLANYVNGLENRLFRIETSTVVKDKLYNGCRIGPTYGFETIRSDNRARAYFRSDGMKFQTGDGSGEVWRDRLYYEYDDVNDVTELVFDGKLSVEALKAISAAIDVVISNTTITNVLSAQTGNIAELTVDSLESSDKVARYNAVPKDVSDMDFVRIMDQEIFFITAKIKTGNPTEQLMDRSGQLLYWIDAVQTGITNTETNWPVTIFQYDEVVKMKISFEPDELGNKSPVMTWGAGTGTGENGKGRIHKDSNSFNFEYTSSTGELRSIKLNDTGITTIPPMSGGSASNIHVLPTIPVDLSQYSEGDIILVPYT